MTGFDWLRPFDHNADREQENYQRHFAQFVDKVGDRVPQRLVRLGERMLENLAWVRRQLVTGPLTFVHGDFHPNNLLAEAPEVEDGTIVIDWQVCSRGPAERDLMYFLVSALESPLRRESARDLIELYHRELVACGVEGHSLQACLRRYRLALLDQVVFLIVVIGMLDFTVNEEAEQVLERLLDRWGGAVLEQDIERLLPA